MPSVLRGHIDEVSAVYFQRAPPMISEDQLNQPTVLFSGDLKGNLNVFNMETRRVRHSIQKYHDHTILAFFQSPHINSSHLYSQGREGCVKCLDLSRISEGDEGMLVGSWNYQSIFSFCRFAPCQLSNTATTFFVPCEKEEVLLLDCRGGSQNVPTCKISPPTQAYDKPFGMITSIVTLEESHLLWLAYEGGLIAEFDVRMLGQERNEPTLRHIFDTLNQQDPIICTAYQNQLDKILVGTAGCDLLMIDRSSSLKSPTSLSSHKFPLQNPGVSHVLCSDVGEGNEMMNRLSFAACWNGDIRVFDLKKKKKLATYKYHTQTVNCLDYSCGSDGNIRLAAASKDSKISVWNVQFEKKAKK